jgi:PAS domain S-box-containing protein
VESDRGEVLGAVVVAQAYPAVLATTLEEIENEAGEYETLTRERKAYRNQALLILLLITTLLLLAATWSALFLAKQVTIPIQALAVATEEVSRGNLDHRVDVPAQDELGTLVDSFNQMTAQLSENRRRLETAFAELDQRRQWMETILESIPAGVLTLASDRRILGANQGVRRLFGAQAVTGAALAEALPPETVRLSEELMARAQQTGFAAQPVELNVAGSRASVAMSVTPLRRGGDEGYVLVLDDLTELLQAQKAAAWQEVAQRIAHEIKNPLTPIQLSADRIRRYLEREPAADAEERLRLRDSLAQCSSLIAEEVHHLKVLVDEFSRFARFPAVQPVPTQLNDIVEGALAVYRDTLNGIRLTTDLGKDLPPVTADPALLRRVLMNLLDNACEAVAQAPTKFIQVTTRHQAGQRLVELAVADSGPGLAPEAKERLFVPFYSTKPAGTGLGLAIVSRIVAEHRGRIRVEDNAPSGARFVVELPVAI